MFKNIHPKIYVACLAAYNNGYLHGKWIDASQDIKEIYYEIKKVLKSNPIPASEEWAIHDYDGFCPISIHEYEEIALVHQKALFVMSYSNLGAAIAEYYHNDLEEAKKVIENDYHGEWETELDFSRDLFNECYAHEIPGNLQYYIDYEQFSRDIFINDYFSLHLDNKVHVIASY